MGMVFYALPVTSLVFTSDSLRILDVGGTHANVWEPLVLVGQDTDSEPSEPSESASDRGKHGRLLYKH